MAGQAPTCWYGHAAALLVGGGIEMTYPGDPGNTSGSSTQLTGAACALTASSGNPGVITITVPVADFARFVASPDSTTLYSVTGSTQTLPAGNAESDAAYLAGLGGQLFNTIDVAQPFDASPLCVGCTPEVPVVPLLLVPGAAVAILGVRRMRRREGSRSAHNPQRTGTCSAGEAGRPRPRTSVCRSLRRPAFYSMWGSDR